MRTRLLLAGVLGVLGVAGVIAAVFAAAGCDNCHTLAAAGSAGTIGPNLDARTPRYLIFRDQVRRGGGGMPRTRER